MRESFLCVTVPPKALRKPKPCRKAIHDWSNNPVHTFTGFCEIRPILIVIIFRNGNLYNVVVVVVVVVVIGGGGGGEEAQAAAAVVVMAVINNCVEEP